MAGQPGELTTLERLGSVAHDGSRIALHPCDVQGRFWRARTVSFAVLLALYIAAPLVRFGGHPAVHLDVPHRRFYLFGGTFNAQDFWLVLLVSTTLVFGLLFITAWLGRAWCGWACPQTVFLEGLYRRVERLIDGPRERRLKAAGGPWTFGRAARAAVKHGLYLGISFLLAHVALSLFTSAPGLLAMMQTGPLEHPVAFGWASAVTAALYFNFAWFREQLCIVVCPYGRLQSALIDPDSMVVGYDVGRGEPRGRFKKNEPVTLDMLAPKKGDCVDCHKCVMACPTGIDIRQGLQMECVACAQCVDACDEVMDTIGKPRGLIRFDSQNGLAGKPTRKVRPRLVAYGALALASTLGLIAAVGLRTPFEANLLRSPGLPWALDGDRVRNVFELHLVNKNPEPSTFRVHVQAPPGAEVLLPQKELTLGSLEDHRLPILIALPRSHGPAELAIGVDDGLSGESVRLPARFLAPAAVR